MSRSSPKSKAFAWVEKGCIATLALFFGIVSFLYAGESPPSQPSPLPQSFWEYLQHPPWIRYIYWLYSGNQRPVGTKVDDKEYMFYPKEWGRMEGALQPGGFYVRHLYAPEYYWEFLINEKKWVWRTNQIAENVYVYGLGSTNWWQISLSPKENKYKLYLSPKNSKPYYTKGAEFLARIIGYWPLRTIQMFGIDGIWREEQIPAKELKIRQQDENHFILESQRTNRVEITVLEWTNRWPLKLRYTVNGQTVHGQKDWLGWYEYNQECFPLPHKIYRKALSKKDLIYTNVILSVKLGLDPNGKNGYNWRQFVPKKAVLTNVILSFNMHEYRLMPDGRLVPLPEGPTPEEHEEFLRKLGLLKPKGHPTLKWIIFLIGVTFTPLGIWLAVRLHRR